MLGNESIYPIRECEFIEENNLVTVFYLNKHPSFIEKIFFRNQLKKPHKIDLDDVGSFIWHLCDGKNTIDQIVEKAKNHFSEKIEPANQRVELFINQMNNNKIIKLYQRK
ncbi:MAG: PqqD family protein [Ignavibacteriae bacterium]|nr:PqqD family protein [Ignavibacteriota bacterium]